MNDPSTSPSELTIELFDRSAVVVDLEPAQVDAWCSGLWSAWESNDEVSDFIDHCRMTGGPVAATVCRSLALLAGGDLAIAAANAAEIHAADLPPALVGAEPVRVIEAWQVNGRASESIVLGCGTDRKSDHAVLLELDDRGNLVDLLLGGDPHELVYGAERSADEVDIRADDEETGLEGLTIAVLEPAVAIERASAVWRAAAQSPHLWQSNVRANEHVVRHRVDITLPSLQHERLDLDLRRGLSESEFAEANAAALSTLQSALGRSAEQLLVDESGGANEAVVAAWAGVISGEVSGLPIEEQRAVLFLEWADWLGAGIGMIRAGVGTSLNGEVLVDFVNRCPEVSTSIAKADRGYVAFAFDVALELVADAGAVTDGALTAAGHAGLAAAMVTSWSGDS